MILVDSDVLIDIIRSIPNAIEWLESLEQPPAISCFAAMELLFGSQNTRELTNVQQFLQKFEIIWPYPTDIMRAASYAKYKLSDGVGLIDALTAALAIGHQMVLITFNKRHFTPIPGIQTIQPYAR